MLFSLFNYLVLVYHIFFNNKDIIYFIILFHNFNKSYEYNLNLNNDFINHIIINIFNIVIKTPL